MLKWVFDGLPFQCNTTGTDKRAAHSELLPGEICFEYVHLDGHHRLVAFLWRLLTRLRHLISAKLQGDSHESHFLMSIDASYRIILFAPNTLRHKDTQSIFWSPTCGEPSRHYSWDWPNLHPRCKLEVKLTTVPWLKIPVLGVWQSTIPKNPDYDAMPNDVVIFCDLWVTKS